MKFNEEDIKNTTFPSGAMGYKKRDVDDFLINVAKDYGSYQRQLDRSKQEAEAAEREKQELLSQLEKQKAEGSQALEKTKQEKQVLKQQLTDLQTESVSNNLNEDTVLSLAQKVALRIEKQAKEEAQLILTNADQYYEEQLKKLEMKRKEIGSEVVNSFSDLIGSERMIVASIDTVKQEYVRLMNDIREKYEELTEEPMKEWKRVNFKPKDIRELTFRRRLFGYRAGDVEDFMRHVLEDYESYQVKNSEIEVYQDEIRQLKEINRTHEETSKKLNDDIQQLQMVNERLQVFEEEVKDLERMKELAQKTADTVQLEAELLLEEARQQKDKLIQEAESAKMNHLLNFQIELGELVNEKDQLNNQIASKKREFFELELQYEDMIATKERVSKEAQVLKQEFLSLRSKLIQKYSEGLDDFIEENQLINQPLADEYEKVLKLTSKRIG